MQKNKKSNIRNGIIIAVVTIIVLFFALKDDFYEKINYIFSFNIWWILGGILLVILYWLLKAQVIKLCGKQIKKDYTFKKSLKLTLDTQFFNAITPFSLGGQPYQVYRLKKQGFNLEQGMNIIIQDCIVYQIALILLGTIAIISNYFCGFFPDNHFLKKLVVLGYIINLSVIIVLFIVAFNKKGNKILLDLAIKIGAKFKIIKDKEAFLEKSNKIIIDFHNSAQTLMKSKSHFINIILLNFIALTLLYLVPYTLIMGLGLEINPFIAIVATAYVMIMGSFVPLPGGSGGLEYGFVRFFGVYVVGAKLSSIMIVWRLLTYYLGLIVGAISLSKKEE